MPITELRVAGLRTLEDVRLPLRGLSVLIGDNGSGKSSLFEACKILQRAVWSTFLQQFHHLHGGLALLRVGAPRLRLGVTVESPSGPLLYDLSLAPRGAFAMIEEERLMRGGPDGALAPLFVRQGALLREADLSAREVPDQGQPILARRALALTDARRAEAVAQVAEALDGIQVHLPFEVLPVWAARSLDRKSALRGASTFEPTQQLSRLGTNLASAYHALKNDFGAEHWQETLGYIRLGLGQDIEDVSTAPSGGSGEIWLRVKFEGQEEQIWASQLSDGMLAYLAFVALFRLAGRAPLSLLAFDEPDLHLHPHLLLRVLDFMDALSRTFPVVLATHSDRLLDGLPDPASAAVLCELDHTRATRLLRPDPDALRAWLERYRGIGSLRSEGYESAIMTRPVEGP
jgi:predicted ATPase